MNKPKTIFCDIDGTLCEYPYSGTRDGNYDFDSDMKPLSGTIKKLWEWDKAGHMIILTTGRKEGIAAQAVATVSMGCCNKAGEKREKKVEGKISFLYLGSPVYLQPLLLVF